MGLAPLSRYELHPSIHRVASVLARLLPLLALPWWPVLAWGQDIPQRQEESELVEAPPPVVQLGKLGEPEQPAPHASGDGLWDDALLPAIPGDPWGDAQEPSLLALRSLFQARYEHTFAERSTNSRESYRVREDALAQDGDGYLINRLFLRMSSDPSKHVGFKTILDFAELITGDAEDMIKQAYGTIRPIPGRLDLVVGLFKIPFATAEMDPSARYEFASFGPGDQLLGTLGFAGRDYGVQVIGAPLRKAKRLSLMLGAFRGHAYDEHDSPVGALAGRIEAKPNKALRFGAGVVSHLGSARYKRPFNTSSKDALPEPVDLRYPAQRRWGRGTAYGLDARFKKKGFMLRAEGVYGERVDVDRSYGAKHFWDAWGIAAYGIGLGPVIKLMPGLRAEWFDADAGRTRGLVQTLSGSITLIGWGRVRLLVDVTHTRVRRNTPVLNQPKPLQADPYLALSNTRLTCQVQLEL